MSALAVLSADDLPSIIDRARASLESARTSAEILAVKIEAQVIYDAAKRAGRLAKAKNAHDDVIQVAYRVQADALELEACAKRRLADEYDAAQERGEVASVGQPKSIVPDGNDIQPATAADVGLTRKEIFEARQVRDAEVGVPGVIRETLNRLVESGEEPTRAAVKREIFATANRLKREEKERRREERRSDVAEPPASRQHFDIWQSSMFDAIDGKDGHGHPSRTCRYRQCAWRAPICIEHH